MLSYRKDIRSRMQREDSIAAGTRFVEVCTGSTARLTGPPEPRQVYAREQTLMLHVGQVSKVPIPDTCTATRRLIRLLHGHVKACHSGAQSGSMAALQNGSHHLGR
jgi:hypothetical protein